MIFINRASLRVTPTMLIGCGGRGTAAVEACNRLARQELFPEERFPGTNGEHTFQNLPTLRFIAIDANTMNDEDHGIQHHLDPINISAGSEIHQALDDPSYPQAGARPVNIIHTMPSRRYYKRVLDRLPAPDAGNCTCPPIGEINFLLRWAHIRDALRAQMRTWQRQVPNDLPFACDSFSTPRTIFIAAGLYGGTGCGVHLHLAAMIRDLLREMEIDNVKIMGIFLLPDLVKDASHDTMRKLRANTYAALKELDYFLSNNPFSVKLGDRSFTIENQADDYLFNNVFLINDRNRDSKTLAPADASEMAGEFMFHYCATAFGPFLSERMVDAPNTKASQDAPIDDSMVRTGKRKTMYSTFGLASAAIPYDTLRWNLTVDFARELMNSLLLQPDHDTEEEQAKINRQQAALDATVMKGHGLMRHLGVTVDQLRNRSEFAIALPQFLGRGMNERLDACRERMQCKNIADLIATSEQQFSQIIREHFIEDKPIDTTSLISSVEEKLVKYKDECIDKGGTSFAINIISSLRDSWRIHKKDAVDDVKEIEFNNNENYFALANSHLRKKKEPKRIGKEEYYREFERNYFRNIKNVCTRRIEWEQNKRLIPVLNQIERVIDQVYQGLTEEHGHFEDIHARILRKTRKYQFSRRLHNAVANDDLLTSFVENFPYPAGNTPEDAADEIRQSGLSVAGKPVAVSHFDNHPNRDELVDALIDFAAAYINRLDSSLWTRTFTESGFFPGSGGKSPIIGNSAVPVDAYRKVFAELTSRSKPYLEYSEEKFYIHATTIVLRPSNLVGEADLERNTWEPLSWPGHDKRFLPSDGNHKNYSLTCFQFHFGLPLYSIDEIEDWKRDYEYILKHDDRPLHKVNLPLPEPYINVLGASGYSESDLKSCFEWAVRNNTSYPIFFTLNPPILHMLEDPEVENIYFILREDQYIDRTELDAWMRGSANALLDGIERELIRLLSATASASDPTLFLQLARAEDKIPLLLQLCDTLAPLPMPQGLKPERRIQIKAGGSGWTVFIDPQITDDEHQRHMIIQRFQKATDPPTLKTDINQERVEMEIMTNAAFRDRFIEKCKEAVMHLRRNNIAEATFPECLREEEA